MPVSYNQLAGLAVYLELWVQHAWVFALFPVTLRLKSPVFALAMLFFRLIPDFVWAQQSGQWKWEDRDAKSHTTEDLNKILSDHRIWMASGKKGALL